jgi:hypothetical protein
MTYPIRGQAVIDLLNNNTRLTLPQVNRLPRIKRRTY